MNAEKISGNVTSSRPPSPREGGQHDGRLDAELRETASRLIAEQYATRVTGSSEPRSNSEAEFDEHLAARPTMTRTDTTINGYGGDDVTLALVERTARRRSKLRPALFYIHGGGMVSGDRFFGLDEYLPWVESHDAILASVEYRLAPAFPDPVPVEDCYSAVRWLFDHAVELNIDPRSVILIGTSAGGGLAAGVSLMLRDRDGPKLMGQMLRSPMLDDRDESVSTLQQDRDAVWDRASNRAAWTALLGARRGTENVSPYAAPARLDVVPGLPPTYLDVGSEDVFRDEVSAFASKIWAADGEAELHVWAGGFHTFDSVVPTAAISRTSLTVRDEWLRRRLTSRCD